MPNRLFLNTQLVQSKTKSAVQVPAKSSQAAARKSVTAILKEHGIEVSRDAAQFITSHFPYPAQRPFRLPTADGEVLVCLDMGHRPGHAFVRISFPGSARPTIETRLREIIQPPA